MWSMVLHVVAVLRCIVWRFMVCVVVCLLLFLVCRSVTSFCHSKNCERVLAKLSSLAHSNALASMLPATEIACQIAKALATAPLG